MDELRKYRQKIDLLDQDIMSLINERFIVIKKIKEYKTQNNLPVLNQSREDEILDKTSKFLYQDSIKAIYQTILKESKEFQRD